MFSESLENTLNKAYARAHQKHHEYMTVEHLLLALVDNDDASEVLSACGANLERLRNTLCIFLDETTPNLSHSVDWGVQPTVSFQRVLQRAMNQAQGIGQSEVNGAHALVAIFGEADSQSVYFLEQENVTRVTVMQYTTHDMVKSQGRSHKNFLLEDRSPESSVHTTTQDPDAEENLLSLYTVNLNAQALRGKSDPLIGRDEEISRIVQTLCRRSKNNPLLVGEAGVGKTALAEGLAKKITDKAVPQALRHCTVYALDLGLLLAGTKYRGDFEKRFKKVLKALNRQTGAIIFIDEIHNLVGAGAATGGAMDAANLIKPFLSSGELRCMGATTYTEFRQTFAKENALLRRFQKIDVEEPSASDTLCILQGLQPKLETYHDVQYTEQALLQAISLSSRYMHDRYLPDKAIDILDEAGAFLQLQSHHSKKRCIGVPEIDHIVSHMLRIPIEQVSQSDRAQLKNLSAHLKQTIFGQDSAVDALCDSIKLSRAGLRHEDKPIGSFLLAGPTGVGKTELCKQLAKGLHVDLLRFDMSEYMEKHAVSRLIGAPPGYVGFEQGGLFTEAVNQKPYAVVLLDEIEKAHPDIFNLLLQVMDYGYLTDSNGRKTDFRHVILVMTTNAGAEFLDKNPIGFADSDTHQDNDIAIKQLFSPEFRNRLDAVLSFDYLQSDMILKVVDKNIAELTDKLQKKNVGLHVDHKARHWLAEHGADLKMGARPMERLIQEKLKKPLADALLFGALSDGKDLQVEVHVKRGQLVWEVVAAGVLCDVTSS